MWLDIEPDAHKWKSLLGGPGKLCRVLHIDKKLNGMSLSANELWIEAGIKVPSKTILKTARIGIGYAEEAKEWPLRFLWNSGSLYESLFQYHPNHWTNASRQNAKNR